MSAHPRQTFGTPTSHVHLSSLPELFSNPLASPFSFCPGQWWPSESSPCEPCNPDFPDWKQISLKRPDLPMNRSVKRGDHGSGSHCSSFSKCSSSQSCLRWHNQSRFSPSQLEPIQQRWRSFRSDLEGRRIGRQALRTIKHLCHTSWKSHPNSQSSQPSLDRVHLAPDSDLAAGYSNLGWQCFDCFLQPLSS